MTKRVLFFLILLLPFSIISVRAESYDDIKNRYHPDTYIVGIAEVESSGDKYKDRSRAEILARLEIAKQIRVRIKEESIDIMCEGEGRIIFAGRSECKNLLITVVETTVDEFLEGSRIVDTGENKDRGTYYAVAVLPRRDASSRAGDKVEKSIDRMKEFIDIARSSIDESVKRRHINNAKKELLKGMAYESERRAIGEAKESVKDLFEELAREIIMIEGADNNGQ